jgi:hypothetical protein
MDGRGRGDGPDLTYVGVKGYAADWYPSHLAKHDAPTSDAWRSSFGPIAAADLSVLDQLLVNGAVRIYMHRCATREIQF